MRIVTVKMPESYIEAIDELVRLGRFSSRSEAIRAAVRELLRKELWGSNTEYEYVHRKRGKVPKVLSIDEEDLI